MLSIWSKGNSIALLSGMDVANLYFKLFIEQPTLGKLESRIINMTPIAQTFNIIGAFLKVL